MTYELRTWVNHTVFVRSREINFKVLFVNNTQLGSRWLFSDEKTNKILQFNPTNEKTSVCFQHYLQLSIFTIKLPKNSKTTATIRPMSATVRKFPQVWSLHSPCIKLSVYSCCLVHKTTMHDVSSIIAHTFTIQNAIIL